MTYAISSITHQLLGLTLCFQCKQDEERCQHRLYCLINGSMMRRSQKKVSFARKHEHRGIGVQEIEGLYRDKGGSTI